MKILHVNLARSFRGGEQQVSYLLEGLQELGLDQVLYAPAEQQLTQRAKRLGVRCVDAGAFSPKWRGVRQLVKAEKIDLVHAHDSGGHTAVWMTNMLGTPVDFVVSRRVYRAPKLSFGQFSKYKHPRLKALLCVSEAIADLHRTADAVAAPVEVIYSAAQQPAVAPKGGLHKLLGLAPDIQLVGTLAALAPEKDLPTFVKTCIHLGREFSSIHFVHIGGGDAELARGIREQAQRGGIGNRFHLLGFREDALALLADLSVFLFTSKWEGFGSSLIQAQLRGVPVVSTRAGGTAEALVAGETGMLAEVGEYAVLAKAVAGYLSSASLRKQHGAAGRAFSAGFSVTRMATLTKSVYSRIVEL